MARLPDAYDAPTRAYQSSVTPLQGPANNIGAATEAAGKAIMGLGATGQDYARQEQRRQLKADEADAATVLARIEARQDNVHNEFQRKVDGDPSGFTQKRMSAFDEDANAFFSQVPEHIKPVVFKRLSGLSTQYERSAQDFENKKKDSYFGDQVINDLEGFKQKTGEDLSKAEAYKEQGLQRIQNAFKSGQISGVKKAALEDAWKTGAALSAAQTELQADPEGLQRKLGVPSIGGDYYSKLRLQESGGNDNAQASSSSASGRYQFIDGTWAGLVNSPEGQQLGLTMAGKNNPEQQEKAIKLFTQQNASALEKAGIEPNEKNTYLAHFMGAGGAVSFIKKMQENSSAPADSASPDAAGANPTIFYKKDSEGNRTVPRTIKEVYSLQTSRFGGSSVKDTGNQPQGIYADLDYDTRLKLSSKAEAQQASNAGRVKMLMSDDLASVERTGQGLDETKLSRQEISKSLGEEAAYTWEQQRARASRLFSVTNGMHDLSVGQLEGRLKRIEPAAGAEGYADDLKAYQKAQKKIDDLIASRETDPALSVDASETVKQARASLKYQEANGRRQYKPEGIQSLVRARLIEQERVGINNPSPVTKSEARSIANELRRAELEGQPKLQEVMQTLKRTYGDYTDSVLASTLKPQNISDELSVATQQVLKDLSAGQMPSPAAAENYQRMLELDQADKAMKGTLPVAPNTPSQSWSEKVISDNAKMIEDYGRVYSREKKQPEPGVHQSAPQSADINSLISAKDDPAALKAQVERYESIYGPGTAATMITEIERRLNIQFLKNEPKP